LYLAAAFATQGLKPQKESLFVAARGELLKGPFDGRSAALLDPRDASVARRLKLHIVSLSSYFPQEGLVTVLVGRTDQLKAEADGVRRILRALTDAAK
jgi:hypothetical protein